MAADVQREARALGTRRAIACPAISRMRQRRWAWLSSPPTYSSTRMRYASIWWC